MLESIFGSLAYGDQEGLSSWLQAHDLAHRTYTRVCQQAGNNIQPVILTGTAVDGDWFGRHGMAHAALTRFYSPGSTTPGSLVFDGQWQSEDGFYQWHQLHDLLHSRINSALGVH